MPVLGRATLELNADTAHLEADLGRTVATATAWGTAIGTVLGNAITSATKKLEAMVSRAIETADAADKLTQRLGVSAEWFSQNAAAAELANVSVGSFSQGIKMLAVHAQETKGKAADAFRAMGLDAKSFGGDTQALFDAVMGKLAGYEDSANKIALANALMGRSGEQLIPMANELEKNRKLAEELGVTLDSDTTAAAARFKDNLKAIELGSSAMGTKIAATLLPVMEKVSGWFVESAKNGERLERAALLVEGGMKVLATAGAVTVGVFSTLGRLIVDVGTAFIEAAKGNFALAFRMVHEGGGTLAKNVTDSVGAVGAIWTETGNSVQATAESTSDKIAAPALLAAEKVKTAKQEFKEFAAVINAMYDEALSGIAADEEIARRRSAAFQAQADTAAMVAKAQVAAQQGTLTEDWDVAPKMAEVTKETQKASAAATQFGFTMASAFEKAVVHGEKLREVFRGLAQDITQMVIHMLVTEQIARAIASSIGAPGVGGAGAMSGISWWSSAPKATSIGMGYDTAGFADGGRPPVGRASIVGERGPELFVPDTAGTIIPNGMGSGVTIYNTVTVAPGGVSAAEVRQALAANQRQTIAVMQDINRR